MDRPVNRCQSPISVASPNAVSVEMPRTHPNRVTTGVNTESAAMAGSRDQGHHAGHASPAGHRTRRRRPIATLGYRIGASAVTARASLSTATPKWVLRPASRSSVGAFDPGANLSTYEGERLDAPVSEGGLAHLRHGS